MVPSIAAAALAVAVSPLLAAPAFTKDAEGGPECGSFVLRGGEKTITLVDNPPDGVSPGDKRVGTRHLVDDDGTPIGEEVFVATTAATGAARGRDLMATEFFFSFSNGWIGGSALYELPNPDDPVHAAGVDLTVVVTGGTGAFANARGIVVLREGDPPIFSFDLTCE